MARVSNIALLVLGCGMIGVATAFIFFFLDAQGIITYHLTDLGISIESLMAASIIVWSLIGAVVGGYKA